ncbi:hypothetical protein H2200_009592 [Cladophialophora chaetospira]|uniref:Nuclear pore complex protein Nup85 n=1 Tax=Cladophialophora chaetospira TaxID=386627 RepID=A0AA38X2Y3_9EURO|nr:hypothetical protein H2200_009592 [Cladophialophora chaetospira]
MNRFTADYSSSINSTPGKEAPSKGFLSSNAPQLASTTPIAPPPSQIFGSSGFGTGVSKFQLPKPTKGSPPRDSPRSRLPPRTKNGTPNIAKVRRDFVTDGPQEEDSDMMEEDEDEQENPYALRRGFQSVNQQPAASLMKFSTTSNRDSRIAATRKSFRTSTRISALPFKGNDTVAQNLARDMGARAPKASLTEPDEVILETEQILRSLDEQSQYLKDSTKALESISEYAYELVKQWQRFVEIDQPTLDSSDIGPQPSAPAFAKANYLGSLLLVLRHPPPGSDDAITPTPQVLLDWLDQYHVSYEGMSKAVVAARPNCTSHDLFWDAVLSLALRGKLQQVMQLFADADFKYAASAADDGTDGEGYKGAQLQTIQSVIFRARQLLNSCPAIQFGDWNVAGPDWDVFRTAVEAALENLTEEATAHEEEEPFEAENFGLRKPENRLLGKLSHKSSNTLPWTIFQNLKILYNILLGSAEEISAQSQDWLEAATSLTIWWDGTADSTAVAQWRFDVSRANNLAVQDEDINPYLVRLRDSFLSVTSSEDPNSFQINGMSPVEVGLACILQGSSQGALTVLRTLSQCIASSVAEIGSKAGWLEDESTSRPAGLNEEDLMVLSYGAPKQGISKDDLLLSYAESLFERSELHLPNGSGVEGWEVSISVVTRLDDREAMRTAVGTFLDQLHVRTQDRAEKLTNLCSDLGLQDEARKVSDRFGDYLIGNTDNYGTALLCYARAHSAGKIRTVIDGLLSSSLIQSRAYPSESDIDDGLRSLVGNPKTALANIAEVDPEAAEILQFYLVGYACIRRFYTLRDQDVGGTKIGQKSLNYQPLARKRAAAKALVAAINSAADSIYGGLYDPERKTAVQVDGLLLLFGEATALLSNSSDEAQGERKRLFTLPHLYALLSAIEDLSTVSARVFAATEHCLAYSIREYSGVEALSPREMLKKSMSSGSGSGEGSAFSYSVLGSEMLGRSMTTEGSGSGVGGSSAVIVRGKGGKGKGKAGGKDHERGWDWRARFVKEGDGDVSGQDILRVLRMAIAEELAWAELEEGAGDVGY